MIGPKYDFPECEGCNTPWPESTLLNRRCPNCVKKEAEEMMRKIKKDAREKQINGFKDIEEMKERARREAEKAEREDEEDQSKTFWVDSEFDKHTHALHDEYHLGTENLFQLLDE